MGKKSKPLSPPPEPPEPEGGKSWSDSMDALLADITEKFPKVKRLDGRLVDEPALVTRPSEITKLANYLRENEHISFNMCRTVTGIDKIDRYEVVYNLARIPVSGTDSAAGYERIGIVVAIEDRSNPSTPSLFKTWKSVDFQEREIFDLLGIRFSGHPDLRRFLLEDEFKGHPLRKDYPLHGRWEDVQAVDAYLDEEQVKILREEAGLEFDPLKDVPPNYKR
jgi:NADH-quinone oxidoreductase subunit C